MLVLRQPSSKPVVPNTLYIRSDPMCDEQVRTRLKWGRKREETRGEKRGIH